MSDQGANIAEVVLAEVERALTPLTDVVTAEDPGTELRRFLMFCGWQVRGELDPAPVVAGITGLAGALDTVRDGLAPDDLEDLVAAVESVSTLFTAVRGIVDLVASGGLRPPTEAEVAVLGEDVLQWLMVRWLARKPLVGDVAPLLGLLENVDVPEATVGGWLTRRAGRRQRFNGRAIRELLADPVGYVRGRVVPHDWADSTDAAATNLLLAQVLGPLLARLGGTWRTHPDALASAEDLVVNGRTAIVEFAVPVADDDGRVRFGTELEMYSAADKDPDGRPGPAVGVAPFGGYSHTISSGQWALTLAVLVSFGGVDRGEPAPAIRISDSGVVLDDDSLDARFDLKAERVGVIDEGSSGPALAVVIGGAVSTRLELGRVALELFAELGQDTDYGGLLSVADAAFVLAAGEGDGFLKKVLPEEVRVPFALGLGWSRLRGLYVESGDDGAGSEGFAGTIPIGLALGPLSIPSVYIALKPDGEKIVLVVAASAEVTLGPVAASIERAGLALELSAPDGGGNAGPVELAATFQPPAGVGLAIKGGLVTGGGYLFADPDAGEYGGAVQLQIGAIGVSAVGLLSTRMPDGSDGFSLLVLISVRFPPIQLGLGFAITAIGGLVGVNRTIAIEELRSGLQSGSLDTILFPPDLAANARKVVSDLGRYFPPVEGQYVFGPTAEIVWGTPALVTIQIGLFLELPSPLRVVLAGKLRMTLPTPEAPVLDLKLDLLGSLDLTAKKLAIDAVLRDSRVAAFTLTGQAAVRLSWGETPGLLIAAGGFHPRFVPPSDSPALSRLTLALGSSDNPRLRLAAYFALTSNTAQVGARLDLYAGVDIPVIGTFSVSAVLGFDALFQFEPFAFVVDITAQIALEWDDDPFLAVRLDMSLSGPKPWHAIGTASFECFGRHEISFDVTVGQAPPPRSLPSEDVEALVVRALGEPAAWSAVPPGDGAAVVSLREGADRVNGVVVVHPLGSLTVSQKVAPLDTELARFGEALVSGARTMRIGDVRLGKVPVYADTVRDQFAPAHFLDMTDAQKLEAPSFQKLPAGARFATAPVTLPSQLLATAVTFDERVIDPGAGPEPTPRTLQSSVPMTAERLMDQVGGSATATGPAVLAAALATEPAVAVVEPQFAIALPGMTVAGGESAHLATYVEAEELRRRAGGRGLLVVETSEIIAGVSS